MAQIGSFVPAEHARVGVFDAVFTRCNRSLSGHRGADSDDRMGASDDLARGRSTFFVELQETSEILARATSRSLIVLDEVRRLRLPHHT
jgi:DNA mismatch repair protein MutS